MKKRNLLIIDFDIEIIKNNPSIMSFTNLHNYFPSRSELILIPGCALAFKNIILDVNNDINIIYMEFLGNFFNPYDLIKFSTEEKIKFTELHIDNQKNKFPLNQDKILEYFSEAILLNKYVKQLDISDNRLNEILFSKIVNCLKKNFNLIEINISNNNLGENSALYIKEIIESNLFLKKLFLSNIHLKNEGIRYIEDTLLKNKTLEQIDLSNNFISYEGALMIKNFLLENSTLKNLNISENNITNELGENPINQSLKYNMGLEEIDFSNCDFNEKSVIDLFEALKENFTLKNLILNRNKFDEKTIIKIWELMSSHNYILNKFSFSHVGINEEAALQIAENLKKNIYLKNLILSNNKINGNSIRIIFEALMENKILLEIDLRNNMGGKAILYDLSSLLSYNNILAKIYLKGNFEDKEKVLKDFNGLSQMIKKRKFEIDINDGI